MNVRYGEDARRLLCVYEARRGESEEQCNRLGTKLKRDGEEYRQRWGVGCCYLEHQGGMKPWSVEC